MEKSCFKNLFKKGEFLEACFGLVLLQRVALKGSIVIVPTLCANVNCNWGRTRVVIDTFINYCRILKRIEKL